MQKRIYARTLVELSRACHVTYESLMNFKKMADFPERRPGKAAYDIAATHEFIQTHKTAHNFGKKRNGADHQNGANANHYKLSEREVAIIEGNQARAVRARVAAKREEFDLAVRMGVYVKLSEVKEDASRTATTLVTELRKAFGEELPPRCEGLSAQQIRKLLLKKLDDIQRTLSHSLAA